MRFESEKEIEDLLFDEWWSLRKSGRISLFDNDISAEDSGEFRDDMARTVYDARLHRQVNIYGTGPSVGDGSADLVETYWTISNFSVDDDSFRIGLNINVYELKNSILVPAHIPQLMRYLKGISRDVRLLYGKNPLIRSYSADYHDRVVSNHYIRVTLQGALIGTGISDEMIGVSSIYDETHIYDFPIKFGVLRFSAVSGLCVVGHVHINDELLKIDEEEIFTKNSIIPLIEKDVLYGELFRAYTYPLRRPGVESLPPNR